MTFKSKMEKLSPPTHPANKKFQRVEVDVQIEDGILSPPTHPANKKNGFQKGGLPIQNRRHKFRSAEQYPKRESIVPHGSASKSLWGITRLPNQTW